MQFGVGLASGAPCTLGSITLSAGLLYGTNYLPADGRSLPILLNTLLFTLLSNTYGGDGITTFALPNLTAQAPNNTQYLICVNGDQP